jgi:hypothetical protein
MAAGNTETQYELCFGYKEKVGGIEFDIWRCHGKSGNMENQRGNGSPRAQGDRISEAWNLKYVLFYSLQFFQKHFPF